MECHLLCKFETESRRGIDNNLALLNGRVEAANEKMSYGMNTMLKLLDCCGMVAVGFMSRVDKNTWNGSSRKTLETEIANKRHMLHNMHDLDARCKKAGVLNSTNMLHI